jgi:hypothetical protein
MPKAFIMNLDTGSVIPVLFNPKEYRVSKYNYWHAGGTSGANMPKMTFANGQPAVMTVQLFFDTYPLKIDVQAHTERITDLMKVSVRDEGRQFKLRPPKVRFHWGLNWSFPSVITSINQNFTLFLPTGTPVRAILDVTFQEIEDRWSFPGQNPTSGGAAGRRVHVVAPGETLDLIAHQELGDASGWRRLAVLNGINDPLRLVPGTVIAVADEED